ncbi:MAG TPA: PhoU domain-containing protein, partial [Steroidobacteraceae bacterium]|nr:PhoU domain-containing protein [Steroidobacteraceae bacterium]
MTAPHTLSALDRELGELAAAVAAMGGLVVDQLGQLLEAMHRGDGGAFGRIAARDAEVDAAQAGIEERVVSLLARMQPMARDLRGVLASQMAALELERRGDHVKRIAKEIGRLAAPLPSEVVSRLLWIGNQARAILQRSLDAYARADATQVPQAWADDAELDRFYKDFLSDLLARMRVESGWV